MQRAIVENWALFLGMFMLMVANGLLVTLLSVRGVELGFSDLTISIMQSAYPAGALLGTILTPMMIEKVGHIRAFSALASLVSISAIIHLLTFDPTSWSAMRFLAGICYPGMYVITESWLNAKSENKIRAQGLSIYFIIQLLGPSIGTAMVGLPDARGNLLFGIVSILISLSIEPLLLSGNKAPAYEVPERMPIRKLYKISPMAIWGNMLSAVAVGAWFISLPIFALSQGFTPAQASGALVVALIVGAMVQYPVGWLSDRVDRRLVILALGVIGGIVCLWMLVDSNPTRMVIGFSLVAASTLPVYGLCIAHANDQLRVSQIVPAAGTMAFVLYVGQFVGVFAGPNAAGMADGKGLMILLAVFSFAVAIVALFRRTQEQAPEETGSAQVMGIVGVPQAGMIQAESWVAEENEGEDTEVG
jgi:MFS family permease